MKRVEEGCTVSFLLQAEGELAAGVRDQFHHGLPDVGRSLAVPDATWHSASGWPIGDIGPVLVSLNSLMERALLRSERGGQTCWNLKVMGAGRTSWSAKQAGGTWIPGLEIPLHEEACRKQTVRLGRAVAGSSPSLTARPASLTLLPRQTREIVAIPAVHKERGDLTHAKQSKQFPSILGIRDFCPRAWGCNARPSNERTMRAKMFPRK